MTIDIYQPQFIHELGQRKNQEDTIYPQDGTATESSRLFIVCDGMGGHECGEVASDAVCRGLSELSVEGIVTDEQFIETLSHAYDVLDAADVNHEGKMGTTMTMLCLHRGGVLTAHIGDSRIYHLRPKTGEIRYRSVDHSLVHQLYELGEISYNDMATSNRKNIILKAMQPYQESRTPATLVHITDIRPGDYFYLCSDGMLEEMEDDELISILQAPSTDEQKMEELVRLTQENFDNHSAYLIHIKDVRHEPSDKGLLSDEEEARRSNKALNDTQKDKAWTVNPMDRTQPNASQQSARERGLTRLLHFLTSWRRGMK